MPITRRLLVDVAEMSLKGPRPRNEDRTFVRVFASGPWWGVFAVADGLGGHGGGERAAEIAIRELNRLADDVAADPTRAEATAVHAAVARAAAAIDAAQSNARRPDLKHMGTTLSLLILGSEGALIGHVGDSRVYRFRDGVAELLTEDHSLAFRLMKEGMLAASEFKSSPMRSRLYRYLGRGGGGVDFARYDAREGDVFALVTDGVLEAAPDLAAQPAPPEYNARGILEHWFRPEHQVKQADNASAVIVRLS